jgi:hypothetical protein
LSARSSLLLASMLNESPFTTSTRLLAAVRTAAVMAVRDVGAGFGGLPVGLFTFPPRTV